MRKMTLANGGFLEIDLPDGDKGHAQIHVLDGSTGESATICTSIPELAEINILISRFLIDNHPF